MKYCEICGKVLNDAANYCFRTDYYKNPVCSTKCDREALNIDTEAKKIVARVIAHNSI